jgi:hypothetical protein
VLTEKENKMGQTKKMNYKETKALLMNFEEMPVEQKEELAQLNKMDIKQLHECLQNNCYNIELLSINHLRDFRKDMNCMEDDVISAVERVNDMTFEDVKHKVDNTIREYDIEAQREREFKKAWKKRAQEVKRELIDEGVIKEHDGWSTTDIVEQRKRMVMAEIELRKEFGYHGNCYDPIVGIIQY